jgi:integrase
MAKIKLTNKIIQEILNTSASKSEETGDTSTKGLVFRSEKGRFTWHFRYSFNGRQRRGKIGDYPELDLQEARKEAIECLHKLKEGIDPFDNRILLGNDNQRTCIEVAHLWIEKLKQQTRNPVYLKNCERHTKRLAKTRIANLPIKQIRTIDIENILQPYWSQPYVHNRFRSSLISIFGFALKHEFINKSPCVKLPKGIEKANDAVFTIEEYKRIIEASKIVNSQTSKCILLIAYTGCRPIDACRAKWNGFDLIRRTWKREATATKQKKEQIVGLSQNVIELLPTIKRSTSPYLFPSESKDGHITDLRKTWKTICDLAKVNGRMYMIRKFVTSELVRNGASPTELQHLMAWSDPTTPLKHYVKIKKEDLAPRMDQLMANIGLQKQNKQ